MSQLVALPLVIGSWCSLAPSLPTSRWHILSPTSSHACILVLFGHSGYESIFIGHSGYWGTLPPGPHINTYALGSTSSHVFDSKDIQMLRSSPKRASFQGPERANLELFLCKHQLSISLKKLIYLLRLQFLETLHIPSFHINLVNFYWTLSY